MVKDLYRLILLHSIKHNLPIDRLLEFGLSYSQIAEFIATLAQQGEVDDEARITPKGEMTLQRLNKKFNERLPGKWLEPQNEERIEKIGLFDVYLPKKSA